MGKTLLAACASALLLFGCSVSVGTRGEPGGLSVEGLAGGYASLPGFRPYDGTISQLDLLKDSARSERCGSSAAVSRSSLGAGAIGGASSSGGRSFADRR